MKVLANVEGLAVRATIETADVPKDAMVTITGDRQVDIAGAGDFIVGHVSVPGKKAEADAECTVETRFKKLIQVKAVGGALAAGALVAAGAAATGNVSTVAAIGAGGWDDAVGVVWVGGAENALIEVLAF